MNDPVRRSWRITRRTLAASLLGACAVAATQIRLSLPSFGAGGGTLDDIAKSPHAAALRTLGQRLLASGTAPPNGLEATLRQRLASGYDAAIAEDRANGRLAAIDGWLVPETQTLAGLWLASAS